MKKPVAIVTGSRRGIGRGIAERLARDGYHVIITDVVVDDPASGAGSYEVQAAIEKAGGSADVKSADISNADDRTGLLEFVRDKFGRLDLLVNNAGVAPKTRLDMLETTEESFDWVMNINLRGVFFLSQAAANMMIEMKRAGRAETPRIVFISSISAYTSSPSRAEYCISKTGISMTAKLFADRLAEYDIPVFEVRPGIIETDMTSGVREKYDKLIAGGLLPTRRWGRPEDVAKAVCALAGGAFDYSTGQVFEVGGGFGLKRL